MPGTPGESWGEGHYDELGYFVAHWIYKIIDTAVFIICIPFYAIAIPLILLSNAMKLRRKVYIGLEVTHWRTPDHREDLRVVDLSRLEEGLVGVHSRSWNVLHAPRLAAAVFGDDRLPKFEGVLAGKRSVEDRQCGLIEIILDAYYPRCDIA